MFMNPAIYCLLNANWKGHHCKCKGDLRWPAGIRKCRTRLCDLKSDHFQMISQFYICDSWVTLLVRLLWIAGRQRPAWPSTVALSEGHLHFPEGRGTPGNRNPDPKSCFDKMKVERSPFSEVSSYIDFFFFLMKLSCPFNKISIWKLWGLVDSRSDLGKGRS